MSTIGLKRADIRIKNKLIHIFLPKIFIMSLFRKCKVV